METGAGKELAKKALETIRELYQGEDHHKCKTYLGWIGWKEKREPQAPKGVHERHGQGTRSQARESPTFQT